MRAMVCTALEGPSSLTLESDWPRPEPGPGEVLIEVAAAALNFADLLSLKGQYQERRQPPFVPGLEISGRVAALGPDVDGGVEGLTLGARVLAIVDGGGYAEFAIAKANDVFVLPEAMDWATAAGFPITYGTAHGGLVWRANLQPGETLAVHGAAGGTGLAAVECGKALGAHVIATARGEERLEVVRAHGADQTIDSEREDLRKLLKQATRGQGLDVVFDPVGGPIFEASLRASAWSGRIVVVGFAGGGSPQIPANILLVKNVTAHGFYWGSYRKHAPELLRRQFADLFGWLEAGKLQPHVSHRLPLAEAQAALALIAERKATGKVVLEIADP